MGKIVLALFLAAAAVMTYFGLQPECAGGKVVQDEAECRRVFDAGFCRLAMAEANRKATIDYAPFSTQNDCLMQFPRCMPHGHVTSGFVPMPRGICLVRGDGGQVAKASPIYERIGQRIER